MHPYRLTVAMAGCRHVQGGAIVAPQNHLRSKNDHSHLSGSARTNILKSIHNEYILC
jgi:hypothetical protein